MEPDEITPVGMDVTALNTTLNTTPSSGTAEVHTSSHPDPGVRQTLDEQYGKSISEGEPPNQPEHPDWA